MRKSARQETSQCCVTNLAADATPSVEGECEQVRKSARVDDVRIATSRVEAEELSDVMVSCGGGGADAASSRPVVLMMNAFQLHLHRLAQMASHPVVRGAGATPSGEGECDQVKKGARQDTRECC